MPNIQTKLDTPNLQNSNINSLQMQSSCTNSHRIVHLTNTTVSKPFKVEMVSFF